MPRMRSLVLMPVVRLGNLDPRTRPQRRARRQAHGSAPVGDRPVSPSRDAQTTPSHTPMGEEFRHNETSGAGRYGEADGLSSHDDRRVHTHNAPETVWPGQHLEAPARNGQLSLLPFRVSPRDNDPQEPSRRASSQTAPVCLPRYAASARRYQLQAQDSRLLLRWVITR